VPSTALQVRTLGVIAAIVTARFPAAKSMEVHLPAGKNPVTYVGDIYDESGTASSSPLTMWTGRTTIDGAPAMLDFVWELDLKHPAWGDGGVASSRGGQGTHGPR
jgi:hypothetical protein